MELLYKELLPYDHIIFDWNGTLLSDVEIVWQILSQSLHKHNLPPISVEEFRDRFSFPIKDFYKSLGMKDEHYASFHHNYLHSYEARYKEAELFAGTLDLVDALKSKGKTLSVLSAAEQGHLHEAVSHFEIMPHMEHVYGLANTAAIGKTERGHDLLKELQGCKDKTVIVGDTLYDADVGKALGIQVLLVADGHQSYRQLAESGCRILPSRFASVP